MEHLATGAPLGSALTALFEAVPSFFRFLGDTWALANENRAALLRGYRTTVLVSLVSMAGALLIGTVVALLRTAPARPSRLLGASYVEFFRNTPLLIQTFFYFFALPRVVLFGVRPSLTAFQAAVIALSIYTGAFAAEAIRAGIIAIDAGQTEAARSLGLGYGGMMRYVVLPQAVRVALPPLANLGIALIKNSSIMYAIALPELFYSTSLVNSRTFLYQETFAVAVAGYLSLTLPLAYAVARLERWAGRSR